MFAKLYFVDDYNFDLLFRNMSAALYVCLEASKMCQNRGSAKTDGFCLCTDAFRIINSGQIYEIPDHIIRNNHSPPSFVDFQRGDLHLSDFIIQKFSKLFELYNPDPSVHNLHLHPSAWWSAKNHKIFRIIYSRMVPDYIIRTRGILGKNRVREERHRGEKVIVESFWASYVRLLGPTESSTSGLIDPGVELLSVGEFCPKIPKYSEQQLIAARYENVPSTTVNCRLFI